MNRFKKKTTKTYLNIHVRFVIAVWFICEVIHLVFRQE